MSAVMDAGLTRHATMTRLEKLLRDRDHLVAKVARAKRSLANLSVRLEEEALDVRTRVLPLIEKHRALSVEIRRLFSEILADARLSPGARKKVKGVLGIIETEMDLGGEAEEPKAHARPLPPPAASAEVPSAQARGAESGQSSLRSIFKRVALALHPDRGSDDEERARRTELMKEVTRAYDEGDLAKLIDLEKTWTESAPPPSPDSEDEHERRCRDLEVINRALRAQVATLTREQRTMRRQRTVGLPMPVAAFVEMAERDLARLVVTRDFVKSFRDREISLRKFLLGPAPEEDDDDLPAELIDELAALMVAAQEDARPRKKRSSRTRSRG